MPLPMFGFTNSDARIKHFKKHVGGKGGGKGWIADMPKAYGTSEEYEAAGILFMSENVSWPPTIEIDCPPDTVIRWNMNTDRFGVAKLVNSQWHLVTFHTRIPEKWLEALRSHRPDIFPRVIKFEHKATLVSETQVVSNSMEVENS
ncbi:MAG: hypothetical protein NTX45_13135 [Proteobacteria bacterium]|nr:hypothetical protein [Pseudomonadota bacterium]